MIFISLQVERLFYEGRQLPNNVHIAHSSALLTYRSLEAHLQIDINKYKIQYLVELQVSS